MCLFEWVINCTRHANARWCFWTNTHRTHPTCKHTSIQLPYWVKAARVACELVRIDVDVCVCEDVLVFFYSQLPRCTNHVECSYVDFWLYVCLCFVVLVRMWWLWRDSTFRVFIRNADCNASAQHDFLVLRITAQLHDFSDHMFLEIVLAFFRNWAVLIRTVESHCKYGRGCEMQIYWPEWNAFQSFVEQTTYISWCVHTFEQSLAIRSSIYSCHTQIDNVVVVRCPRRNAIAVLSHFLVQQIAQYVPVIIGGVTIAPKLDCRELHLCDTIVGVTSPTKMFLSIDQLQHKTFNGCWLLASGQQNDRSVKV